jgi:hypothetical protein
MKINYKMIRGPVQSLRCTDDLKGRLYCECGCQSPHDDDPIVDLTGVIVMGRASHGYADYILSCGDESGEINTQYCALIWGGHEYLGCDHEQLRPIFNQIFAGDKSKFARADDINTAGDTLEETAAAVIICEQLTLVEQDDRNRSHPGYCERCHSFCYGDCLSG